MVIKLGVLDSQATVPFSKCQHLPDVSKIRKLSALRPENKIPEKLAGGKKKGKCALNEGSGFRVSSLNVVYTNVVNYSDVIK